MRLGEEERLFDNAYPIRGAHIYENNLTFAVFAGVIKKKWAVRIWCKSETEKEFGNPVFERDFRSEKKAVFMVDAIAKTIALVSAQHALRKREK